MDALVSFIPVALIVGFQVAAGFFLTGHRRGVDSGEWRARNMSRAERARWADRSLRAARASRRGTLPW